MDGVLVEDAATRIGITAARVRRLVRTGRITVKSRIGGLLLLDSKDVEREAARSERTRTWLAGVERM